MLYNTLLSEPGAPATYLHGFYAFELSLLSAELQGPGQRQHYYTATESEASWDGGAGAVHGVVVVKGRGLDNDADHLCRRVNTHHNHKQLELRRSASTSHSSPPTASSCSSQASLW